MHFIINFTHNGQYLYKSQIKRKSFFFISTLILKSLNTKKFSPCFEYLILIYLPFHNRFMPLILLGFFRFMRERKSSNTQMRSRKAHNRYKNSSSIISTFWFQRQQWKVLFPHHSPSTLKKVCSITYTTETDWLAAREKSIQIS